MDDGTGGAEEHRVMEDGEGADGEVVAMVEGGEGKRPRNDLPQRKRNQMQSRQVPKSRRRLVVRMPQNPKTRRMHLTRRTRKRH